MPEPKVRVRRSYQDPASPWWTINRCALEAGCSTKLLYRAIAAKEKDWGDKPRLRAARLGGGSSPIRIHRDWLIAWLEASATPVEIRPVRFSPRSA